MQLWDFHGVFHPLFLHTELFTVPGILTDFYLIFLFATGEPMLTAASLLYCKDLLLFFFF